jgi:hypothetical protein
MTDHYTPAFFAARAERADRDARLMVPDISCALGKCPESVIDFGCGDGAMLVWWHAMGATSLVGVDAHGPPNWSTRVPGLHVAQDLAKPIDLGIMADLVVCLEVAEHLPWSAADTLVDTLCRHGKRIMFSAAPPGQGGTGHLNEQPFAYWAEKFARHGYRAQDILRHRLSPQVSRWYRANAVLMCHDSARVVVPRTQICTATYRDCFADVQDAVSDLTKGALLPQVYGAVPFGIHRLSHDACVDKMRSRIADESIMNPEFREFEYSLWVDADQVFAPQQAIDLVVACQANGWDVCSGLYVTKQKEARIVHRVDGKSRPMPVGPYARPYTVDGIGFGFAVTRNEVFLRMVQDPRSGVDRTWFSEGVFVWDFFRPTLGEPSDEWLCPDTGRLAAPYWNEDTAFSEKARACGIDLWIQPQIFVKHRGRFDFGLENLQLQQAQQ